IVALTANALQGDRERCLAVGMNEYLTKPIQLADLEKVLQRALLKASVRPDSTEPQSGPDASLDATVIAGLRDLREPGQPDPLGELIDAFFRDARPRIEHIEAALRAGDGAKAAAAAHTLKGSASNLGARRLASLCAQIEKHAKAGEVTDASGLLASVLAEFDQVERLLLAERLK
ncbi:MAG TPA: Hpt domain-containing protein, partial [Methylomirabilota bacterium]|nr:Hpt domain-containing protein [Methylomirabilota bacterium]